MPATDLPKTEVEIDVTASTVTAEEDDEEDEEEFIAA